MPQINKKRLRAANKALAKQADDDLPDLDDLQQYAKVYKAEGNEKFIVLLNNGELASVHLCGKMRRRVWVMKDDIVIVSLREGFAKEDHSSFGKIMKGDMCGKIPTTMYGKLKKIEGFNLLKQIITNDNGSLTLGTSTTVGGAGGSDALYEYVYEGEDEDNVDSGDESDVSHDSQKKEKRKKKGQALKFGISVNEDVDSSKITEKVIDDI